MALLDTLLLGRTVTTTVPPSPTDSSTSAGLTPAGNAATTCVCSWLASTAVDVFTDSVKLTISTGPCATPLRGRAGSVTDGAGNYGNNERCTVLIIRIILGERTASCRHSLMPAAVDTDRRCLLPVAAASDRRTLRWLPSAAVF